MTCWVSNYFVTLYFLQVSTCSLKHLIITKTTKQTLSVSISIRRIKPASNSGITCLEKVGQINRVKRSNLSEAFCSRTQVSWSGFQPTLLWLKASLNCLAMKSWSKDYRLVSLAFIIWNQSTDDDKSRSLESLNLLWGSRIHSRTSSQRTKQNKVQQRRYTHIANRTFKISFKNFSPISQVSESWVFTSGTPWPTLVSRNSQSVVTKAMNGTQPRWI